MRTWVNLFSHFLQSFSMSSLVSLHANRNQLKQSSAALLEVVKKYSSDPDDKVATKDLLTRVQTLVRDCFFTVLIALFVFCSLFLFIFSHQVGDCWSFYTNTLDPWKYDHVVFYQVEELIKVAKRLLMAAKCGTSIHLIFLFHLVVFLPSLPLFFC